MNSIKTEFTDFFLFFTKIKINKQILRYLLRSWTTHFAQNNWKIMWIFLVVVLITWMVRRRWQMRRQVALAKQLKTNLKAYPILGHMYKFLGTNEDRMRTLEAFGKDAIEAGGISKLLNLDQLVICVADPVAAEVALNKCLEKHDIIRKVFGFAAGNVSSIAPVSIWRHRRKIDAPVFNTKNLIQFVDCFSERSVAMANLLEKEADKGTFSVLEYTVTCSTNIVCETAMGIQNNFQGSEFLTAIKELWEIGVYTMFKPWFHTEFTAQFMPGYNTVIKNKRTVYNFIAENIRIKQKLLNEKSNNPVNNLPKSKLSSFLDLQLDPSDSTRKLTDQELLEETLQLVVLGFDTTATSLAFIVVMLSRHTDIQDKVYEELQQVFKCSDRPVTYEDLCRLQYVEAVIKETLRLYPIGPIIARQADKDFELASGITVVKGCGIMVNIWAIHRNPKYWGEDADQFRPERFLNYTPKHPAAFMPFSYGPRGCIGYRYAMLSLKTMLSTLLRRYRVLPPPGVAQGEPLKTKYEIILRHVDNFEIQLQRR